MKTSLNWLKRYVDIDESPETLAHDLTMFGLNIEEVQHLAPPFKGVVFGKVLEVARHPEADRLSVCKVDVGGESPLGIVCGAPNVRAGLNVPVALHGAVLDGGFKIKRTKIRGVTSEGMICSEIELGIGSDTEGIIELDFEEKPGASLEGRLGNSDVVLDVEVTPNRPDQLCHLGIAREIAALYKKTLRVPECLTLQEGYPFELSVESGTDCPRYSAAFVEDVTIGPSPKWMQDLLIAAGAKPINNIVDVTNFVLMEMGQPLHAFDLDTLPGEAILVRRAGRGEEIITLDGVRRDLDEDILVITDGQRPVALAGIMGGEETEVKAKTKRLLIESAMFNPRVVRMGSRKLKLETEASYRFEREGDVGITSAALERACRLIEEIGAGKLAGRYAETLSKEAHIENRTVNLRVKQTNRLMGTHLGAGEIASLLERLGLESRAAGKSVQVSIPTFRRDITEEIDLVEEVARVYGYENIGREETVKGNIFALASTNDRREREICNYLAYRGLAEVITTSFMDPQDPVRFGWRGEDRRSKPIQIANPLTVAQSVLRTSLLPGLLGVVRRNIQADQEGIHIFEMGRVFLKSLEGGGLPDEECHLTAVFTRKSKPVQWLENQRSIDYFDMKGELEGLLRRLGVESRLKMTRAYEDNHSFIFNWLLKNELIVEGGLLPGKVCAAFDIDTPVFYFDLIIDKLPETARGGPRFTGISPYPEVKRDLCVVADGRTTFAAIRNVIVSRAKNLEAIGLLDYYRGGHLGSGKRSYTFRLSFRSNKGTLSDSDVDGEIERILTALQRELHVTLRTE